MDSNDVFMFYPVKQHDGRQVYMAFDDDQLKKWPELAADDSTARQEWMDRLSPEQQRAMKIAYEKIIADKQASKNQP